MCVCVNCVILVFYFEKGSWDNSIRLWDIEKEIDIYSWHTSSAVTAMKYWHNQNILISAHSNHKICVWDPRTDKVTNTKSSQYTFRSHALPITFIAVSTNYNTGNQIPLFVSGFYFFIFYFLFFISIFFFYGMCEI